MTEPAGPTQVVTFYSYKGGVGRTMALVNTAYVLARDGWRVLMVDCDLEAPGITHSFAREVGQRPEHVRKDVLDLLLDAKGSLVEADLKGKAPDYPRSLAEYVVPIALPDAWLEKPGNGIPYKNGRLDLIPATLEPRRTKADPEAEPLPDYLERLSELDLAGLFLPGGLGHLFGDHVRKHFVSARFEAPGDILFTLRNPIQAAYDIVLIDARTGLNEIAGFSIGTVADALVLCCGLNQQNIEGTRFFMRKAGLFDERAKPFLVAFGPVPPWHEPEVGQRLRMLRRALYLRQDLDKTFENLSEDFEDPEEGLLGIAYDFPEVVEIPYHPQAAIRETVFVTELPRAEISQAYSKLASRVRSKLLPGALEATEGHLRFLDLLHNPGKKGLQNFCRFSARKLPELRLLNRQRALVPVFPTACGIISLPNLTKREDFEQIAVAAAVSALRLNSPAPFERAWELFYRLADKQPLACLSYFQSATPFPLPDAAVEWWAGQSKSANFSSYLAYLTISSHDPERFPVEASNGERLEELASRIPLSASLRSVWRWSAAPSTRETILEIARAVASLASGALREDLKSQHVLGKTYRLPAEPDQILSGDVALRNLARYRAQTLACPRVWPGCGRSGCFVRES